MSVTYFSLFSPETFQIEVKNKFIQRKLFGLKQKNNLSQNHQLITENNSNNKTRTTYYKTATNFNINTNDENIRDIISTKRMIKKIKPKAKYILSQALNEKTQPYKQYLLEKRQLENIKNEKNRYKLFISRNKKDLFALPDKSKIKGVYFSKQKGFGFFDQIAESKNYSKDKINNNRKPAFMVRRSKYDEFDLTILDDIKANKRKNIFEENFGIKYYLKYDKFRHNAMSFLKYLNEDPNYNF